MPIPGKTFRISYIWAINKTVETTNAEIFTAVTYHNHKMSSVSRDTSRETATPLTDGCFSSARRH